jgi:oligopeptide transport system substrate-binding protein
VPLSDIDRVKSNPVLSNEFVISPSLSTYYYGINTTAPIVDDVRVRRALSLAVDRQGLIDNVTKGGQEPAGWFCRPGLVACPTREDHPDLGVEFDPEQAREILQEYLDETGQSVDELELTLMFNTSEGNQRIAEAVVGMWQEYLGLTVELVNQEWRVFLDTIKSLDTPQIYRSGWTLDYPDANNFTREVVVPGGNDNPVDANGNPAGGLMWRNEEFNELVDQAATELDPDVRVELYAEAEEILVWEDAAIIPVYWYTAVSVTKPYVQRTYSNIGLQHIEKWDLTAE